MDMEDIQNISRCSFDCGTSIQHSFDYGISIQHLINSSKHESLKHVFLDLRSWPIHLKPFRLERVLRAEKTPQVPWIYAIWRFSTISKWCFEIHQDTFPSNGVSWGNTGSLSSFSTDAPLNAGMITGGFTSLPMRKHQKNRDPSNHCADVVCFYDDSLLFFFFRSGSASETYVSYDLLKPTVGHIQWWCWECDLDIARSRRDEWCKLRGCRVQNQTYLQVVHCSSWSLC